MADATDFVRMEVRGLVIDSSSNAPIVLLRDETGEAILPIWIGPFEASAISVAFEQQAMPRPLTHDLLLSAFSRLGARVEHVAVTDLRDGTFFAEVHVTHSGEPLIFDSRPSDAIAIALRVRCPILVARSVLAQAQISIHSEDEDDKQERLRRMLEELDADELGKYTM
ncbi:MAG: bifunctional nuclease family protein [Thermoanaerobaculia bacterium]|nr:bifunctional nuclease family protein [Thermoanaerobaculia bacterium]